MTCDLELEIAAGREPGVYTVAVDSPAGGAAGTIRVDTTGLLGRRRELAARVLLSAAPVRLTDLEGPVREVGTALFDAVFVERVYGRYQQIREHAAAQDWDAVLAVNDQLAAADPAAADPDHLASTARQRLAYRQEAEATKARD
jgi:hypothetical protein